MMDMGKVLERITFIARANHIELKHVRLYRWRVRLAMVIFRIACAVAGFGFSVEEWEEY